MKLADCKSGFVMMGDGSSSESQLSLSHLGYIACLLVPMISCSTVQWLQILGSEKNFNRGTFDVGYYWV